MDTFNLLVIFKQLFLLILLSLAHADKQTSVDKTAAAISRRAIPQKFDFVNFKEDKFSFLNITAIVKRVVEESLSCAFSCLDNLACLSFNVAAFPDKAGKFTCEILSSDKYNNSEGFLPSKTFHHFSIVSSNQIKKTRGQCFLTYERSSISAAWSGSDETVWREKKKKRLRGFSNTIFEPPPHLLKSYAHISVGPLTRAENVSRHVTICLVKTTESASLFTKQTAIFASAIKDSPENSARSIFAQLDLRCINSHAISSRRHRLPRGALQEVFAKV
ncbi:uncharacterized protein LOC141860129 isoform X3 [Acropora palmata]|uniref:uncharacterized protein LOC141860129 isoform X3 n=1 Tax=Acropora palmata TaxID=6131 RepID=UPI003DA0DEED